MTVQTAARHTEQSSASASATVKTSATGTERTVTNTTTRVTEWSEPDSLGRQYPRRTVETVSGSETRRDSGTTAVSRTDIQTERAAADSVSDYAAAEEHRAAETQTSRMTAPWWVWAAAAAAVLTALGLRLRKRG